MLCKVLLLLLRRSELQRCLRLPSSLCGHFCWGMLRRRLLLLWLGPGLLPPRWRCGQEQGRARSSSWGMCCLGGCLLPGRSRRLPAVWPRRRGVKPKALGRARSQKLGLDRPHCVAARGADPDASLLVHRVLETKLISCP
jgi:hypothetical protein